MVSPAGGATGRSRSLLVVGPLRLSHVLVSAATLLICALFRPRAADCRCEPPVKMRPPPLRLLTAPAPLPPPLPVTKLPEALLPPAVAPPGGGLGVLGDSAGKYAHELLSRVASTCHVCSVVPPAPSVPTTAIVRRCTRETLQTYVTLAMSDAIVGFMNFPSKVAFAVITRAQHDAGVFGSVGEIGVHHGRSFILAALLSAVNEPLWALDLWESLQSLNLDGSGDGSLVALTQNLAAVGLNISDVSVQSMSSLDLPRDYWCSSRMPLFRWFSVDGMHTEAATRIDMHSGLCHLMEGGVIAVDDIFNNLFLGVTEGVFAFASMNRDKLAPFFAITGKVYFTTPSHHARYLAAVEAFFVSRYAAYTDPRRTVLFGWRIVSHSVPVHHDITSTPERADRVLADMLEALSM